MMTYPSLKTISPSMHISTSMPFPVDETLSYKFTVPPDFSITPTSTPTPSTHTILEIIFSGKQ
jgi:hypothetical protein|tara:strand:- start:354 stop:542 length:189 start_codon:yes stop_codon:yes gene_type:complete